MRLFNTGYAELLTRSNFSFLRGASHPSELVQRAAALGLDAIGLADDCSLSGMVRAHEAAKEHGIHLLVGARFTPVDGPELALYVRDREGYTNLCRLISLARRRAPKSEYYLEVEDLARFSEGLLAVIAPIREEEKRIHHEDHREHGGRKKENCLSTDEHRWRQIKKDEEKKEFEEKSKSHNKHDKHDEHDQKKTGVQSSEALRLSNSSLHNVYDVHHGSSSSLIRYRQIFGQDCFLAVSRSLGGNDSLSLQRQFALAEALGIPPLASNDVHYHTPQRQPLHDVVTCIRHGCTLAEAGYRLHPNAEAYLKSEAQMLKLFAADSAWQDAVARTVEAAARCRFILDELTYTYPDGIYPPEMTPREFLRQETMKGAARRYPDGVPDKVLKLIERELELVGELEYEQYFLTIYEIVSFARNRGILCQGRGSAANSAVCYCLGITSVDPAHHNLLFERFISKERNEPPDIDIDFENKRREEVYEHIYSKYGRHRAGLTAVIISYRRKSAIREVGKVLGLSLDQIDILTKGVDALRNPELCDQRLREHGFDPGERTLQMVVRLARQLYGFPRHLSQHVGGFVITRGRLDELVPVENAAMDGRTIIQWDKDDLDALGILKVDCLALGMLTAVQKAFALIRQHHGQHWDMASVLATDLVGEETEPRKHENTKEEKKAHHREHRGHEGREEERVLSADERRFTQIIRKEEKREFEFEEKEEGERELEEAVKGEEEESAFLSEMRVSEARPHFVSKGADPHQLPPLNVGVYDMICAGDTLGVFQIESRAQMQMLPRLKPRNFYDLVIEVAIIRPGPIQGGMVHPYLRRRNGEEPVVYPHPCCEKALGKTLGVPLFQEQVMQLAIEAAGYSGGEADQLRKAMAAWKRNGQLEKHRERLLKGMREKGIADEFAERLFEQVKGFSSYGFPESHAASFALIVYVSCFLKRYYPAAFTCGLINAQPMGFYSVSSLIRDAREHGVEVRPPDVNSSLFDSTLEEQPLVGGTGAFGELDASGRMRPPYLASVCADKPLDENSRYVLENSPATWGYGGPSLRLGLRQVRGLKEEVAEAIIFEREMRGPFTSIESFIRRTRADKGSLQRLAEADAFAGLGVNRRQALWQVTAWEELPPLFRGLEEVEKKEIGPRKHESTKEEKKNYHREHEEHEEHEGRKEEKRVLATDEHRLREMKKDEEQREYEEKKERKAEEEERKRELEAGRREEEAAFLSEMRVSEAKPHFVSKGADDVTGVIEKQHSQEAEALANLPELHMEEQVVADYASMGLSLKSHPIALMRDRLDPLGIVRSSELHKVPEGRFIEVAGIVITRQRPGTAKGVMFISLEDESGVFNIILWPKIFEKFRKEARLSRMLKVRGEVQRDDTGAVTNIIASVVTDLADVLKATPLEVAQHTRSRDFH